jgi:predicted membrane-bound mannosyltransferase
MCATAKGEWKKWFSKKRMSDFILMTISFFLVAIHFYSAFATDFEGLKRVFVDAPLSYLQRAAGSEMSEGASSHVHEWWWYLKILFCPESVYWSRFSSMPFMKALSRTVLTGWRFTEFPLLLSAILPVFFTRFIGDKDRHIKLIYFFSLIYFLSLLLIYSLIPYKTPWCMLTVVQAMALAAALGIGVIVNAVGINKFIKPIAVVVILLSVSSVHWRGVSFMCRVPDSTAIPYNYAQSSYDVKNLSERIVSVLRDTKEGEFAAVVLSASDTWPIPWYVRKYSGKIGYWTDWESFNATKKHGTLKCIVAAESDSDKVRQSFPEYNEEWGHTVRPGVFVRFFTKGRNDANKGK